MRACAFYRCKLLAISSCRDGLGPFDLYLAMYKYVSLSPMTLHVSPENTALRTARLGIPILHYEYPTHEEKVIFSFFFTQFSVKK
jgi:hypothetical protein